jgi:hypothetical protein
MGTLDELLLGHALKKLTDVFEGLVIASKKATSGLPADRPMLDSRQCKAAVKVPAWLRRLKANKPYDVSRVLFEQIRIAHTLKLDVRFEAQMGLLEALVEEGLAMDAVSYSVACRQVADVWPAPAPGVDATSGFLKRKP